MRCLKFEPQSCIFYAMSLLTELNSQKKVIFLQNNLNYPLKIIKLNNRLHRVQLNLDLTIFFLSH